MYCIRIACTTGISKTVRKDVNVIDKFDSSVILQQHGNMVYQLALVQMKNKADAEDVFQDVFLQLVKSAPEFQSDEHVKAWLIRVCLNRCRNYWKSFWYQKSVPLDDKIPASDSLYDDSDIYEQVLSLGSKYRAVIHLHYYEDMPIDQISRALNISYDTAAKRLSRAREQLRTILSKEGSCNEY